MKEIIISAIAAIATGVIGFFQGRRLNNAKARQAEAKADFMELDGVEKAIAIWRELANELTGEVRRLTAKCEELLVEVDALRKENKLLKVDMGKLKRSLDTNSNNN